MNYKTAVKLIKTFFNMFQYLTASDPNDSIFDNSQQHLINSTIDSTINLDETDDTININGGNSYTQKPILNWNFLHPIIGPNG